MEGKDYAAERGRLSQRPACGRSGANAWLTAKIFGNTLTLVPSTSARSLDHGAFDPLVTVLPLLRHLRRSRTSD